MPSSIISNGLVNLTITGTGGGSGGGSSGTWTTTTNTGYITYTGTGAYSSTSVNYDYTNITVKTKSGKELNLTDSLDKIEKISDIIGFITPEKGLLVKYPALKSAYEEYERQLRLAFIDSRPELKEAMESYKTMETLLRSGENDK